MIFTTTCWSGFLAAAGLTGFAGLVCATDGAALADAAAAGVALAAAAGVALAVVAAAGVADAVVFAAGVVLAVVAVAGVAVAFGPFGAVTDLGAAGEAFGDALASAAGAFLSFRLVDFSFFASGVALAAGWSAEVFISGVVAGAGFRVFGAVFSGFVGAGDSIAAGSFSFTTGASFTAGASFKAGASVFGARVGRGFTSVGGFFSGPFLLGDSSGVGCWAITAPANASEATISKLVNFFIFILLSLLVG